MQLVEPGEALRTWNMGLYMGITLSDGCYVCSLGSTIILVILLLFS